MVDLLYPPGNQLKERMHRVAKHPLYNFLHRYYRYTVDDLLRYSSGLGVKLPVQNARDLELVSSKFLTVQDDYFWYDPKMLQLQLTADGKLGWIDLGHNYRILEATRRKSPFFGCFGFHEWAMLYSGGSSSTSKPLKKHQEACPLRVSQEVIDTVVEQNALRCTHFDAWRFFHPNAQPRNIIHPLSRATQTQYDQPGCIHATMDLFKFAYQLYPMVSSELLRQTLELALVARDIDMRASPYDVSNFPEFTAGPICVETIEGRAQYAAEQEQLYRRSQPIREELLRVYCIALGRCHENSASHL